MLVTLIADAPAGDKAERELKQLEGVTLHYIRNNRNTAPTIPADSKFVLCMNAGAHGIEHNIKDQCNRIGAKYIPIPPSWSKTVIILGTHGFYDAIKKEPLTHKPFANVATKLEEVKLPAVVPSAPVVAPQPGTKAAWTTPETTLGEKANTPVNPWIATRILRAKEAGEDAQKQLRAGLAAMDIGAAYQKYEETQKAAGRHAVSDGLFRTLRHRVRHEMGMPDDHVPHSGKVYGDTTPAERHAWVRDWLKTQPEIPAQTEIREAMVAKFGVGAASEVLSALVKNERKRRGRTSQAAAQSEEITTSSELPSDVVEAQKRLVDTLRASKTVSIYSLTYAGGEAESTFEFTAKGKTKL